MFSSSRFNTVDVSTMVICIVILVGECTALWASQQQPAVVRRTAVYPELSVHCFFSAGVACSYTIQCETCIKNHFFKMKKDIGMANYEKQGKQEAAYPIPISL